MIVLNTDVIVSNVFYLTDLLCQSLAYWFMSTTLCVLPYGKKQSVFYFISFFPHDLVVKWQFLILLNFVSLQLILG